MLSTIFATLIGLGALLALGVAFRTWGQGEAGRQTAIGWLIFAAASAIQVFNLLTTYNMWLSVVTTIGMLAGVWMVRGRLRQA